MINPLKIHPLSGDVLNGNSRFNLDLKGGGGLLNQGSTQGDGRLAVASTKNPYNANDVPRVFTNSE